MILASSGLSLRGAPGDGELVSYVLSTLPSRGARRRLAARDLPQAARRRGRRDAAAGAVQRRRASVEFAPSFVSYLEAQCGPGGFGYNWRMLTSLFGYRVGKREEFRDDLKTN